MKNIIIFTQNLSISSAYGIGLFIDVLISTFNRANFNIYLIKSCSKSSELEIFVNKKVTKITIPFKGDTNVIINLLSLYIKEINDSIVFISYYNQFKLAEFFKKQTTARLVGIIHSFTWTWRLFDSGKLHKDIEHNGIPSKGMKFMTESVLNGKDILQYYDKVVALSDDSLKVLEKIYGIEKNKLSLIPNGIKDVFEMNVLKENLKHELHLNLDEKIILYVGRLDRLKGVDALVGAFNKLIYKYAKCRLVFIGDGQFDAVSNKLGQAASRVFFTGRISQSELKKWYSIADIAVLPSLSEECSFVGIEMMMHRLPIISTNGRGVRCMFHDMENSLTVDCRSGQNIFESELYEAMLRLLTDENIANDLRKKSRQWYLDNYQLKYMKQQYIALVEELTQNKSE